MKVSSCSQGILSISLHSYFLLINGNDAQTISQINIRAASKRNDLVEEILYQRPWGQIIEEIEMKTKTHFYLETKLRGIRKSRTSGVAIEKFQRL